MTLLILIITGTFILGWLLDFYFGDPSGFHPIIWFGKIIAWGERLFNKGRARVLKGAMITIVIDILTFIISLLIPLWLLIVGINELLNLKYNPDFYNPIVLFGSLILFMIYECAGVFYSLAGTTLIREVRDVFKAVDRSLDEGRKQVARIVGRDTSHLTAQEVRTASLETLAENLSDGVIAPMFWYMLLGVPGMLTYKMINTQDSMVGYKTDRYKDYGRFAAKIDDGANYLPSRLTAFLMIVSSGKCSLLSFVQRYGRQHASPNSGYPEAALAGILKCRFGGSHDYFGETIYKPYIGEKEKQLTTQDMMIATKINRKAEIIMVIITLGIRFLVLTTLF